MVKSLLIGLVALLALAVGVTAASSKSSASPVKNVNRLCVWVEGPNTPDTAFDLKSKKAYTATHKICIVGKAGKNGKNGKNGKAGAKGAQGIAGALGAQGSAGAAGAKGDAGANGSNGIDGKNGADGVDGDDGQSVTSAVEQPGDNCPDGGSSFTAANGITYACNGADGEDGDDGADSTVPGPPGPPGFSGIVSVGGGSATGDKQFTVPCPLNLATPDLTDRLVAISGGWDIQGSVTADYRSNTDGVATGSPANLTVGNAWTVVQTSGQNLSGTVYVYCLAPAAA